MIRGFRNFLMQGELVVVSVGLVVALAFSTLIKSFTDNIITPLVNAAAGSGPHTTGVVVTVNHQHVTIGSFIGAVIYFVVFMAVVYFLIVSPYRAYMKRRGATVFGEAPPMKACPYCLSTGLPVAATRCRYCGSDVVTDPTTGAAPPVPAP